MSTAERRAREKIQRRQEILDAAREEFFDRGFHTPTVDDVATRAQVSKGTIYLYFASKEEILAHLLIEGLDLLVSSLEDIYTMHTSSAPEIILRTLADEYLHFAQQNPSYFRLILAFDRGRFEESISHELFQEVLDHSLEGLSVLARSIECGVEQGTFHVADPWRAAGATWAALNGAIVLMSHPLRQKMLATDLETMFHCTLDLVVAGLKDGQKA